MLNQLLLMKFTPDYFMNWPGQSELLKITFMNSSKLIKLCDV